MLQFFTLITLSLSLCFLVASEVLGNEKKIDANNPPPEQKAVVEGEQKKITSPSFKQIEWNDLIPEEDLDVLMNPPSYIDDLEENATDDEIADMLNDAVNSAANNRYQQALVSTNIIQQLNAQTIRIPGFVVPVEFDEESITEFFLVPYFGACIHSPPPPPNQIIYVHAPQGLKLDTLYDPFWISGTLSTKLIENYMATAAYSLKMASYEPYTE